MSVLMEEGLKEIQDRQNDHFTDDEIEQYWAESKQFDDCEELFLGIED